MSTERTEDLYRQLGRIEGKQDQILVSIKQAREENDKNDKRIIGVETELDKVKSTFNYTAGFFAAVSGLMILFRDSLLRIVS